MNHIAAFSHKIALWVSDDATMCKMFPGSLDKGALKWFQSLKPRSIRSWNQLATEFVRHYIANSRDAVSLDTLFGLRKEKSESLRRFANRFMECYAEIDGCDEKTAITAFKRAILFESS